MLIHLPAAYTSTVQADTDSGRARVRLMDGDEPPDWALRTLGQGGYPSRHVHAVMDLGQVDMDRLGSFRGVRRREGTTMAVLLADGVRHTARSMFAAKADHPYLDDRACSWGRPNRTCSPSAPGAEGGPTSWPASTWRCYWGTSDCAPP